jgi:hypothetical protein
MAGRLILMRFNRPSIEPAVMHEPEKPAPFRNRTGLDILSEQHAALLPK